MTLQILSKVGSQKLIKSINESNISIKLKSQYNLEV